MLHRLFLDEYSDEPKFNKINLIMFNMKPISFIGFKWEKFIEVN